jgi:hypothetical protein
MAIEAKPSGARTSAEMLAPFRLGQLLVLFEAASEIRSPALDVDRLGYYEFLTANPFLVVEADSIEGTRLLMAGFDYRNLDYQSSAQRFTNRRARLHHDLSLLVARGLVVTAPQSGRVRYELSELGRESAVRLNTLYAYALKEAAAIVLRRLRGLSDKQLRLRAQIALQSSDLLVDLYD